jgi:hypothetical protein
METDKDYNLSNFGYLWFLKLSYKTTKYYSLNQKWKVFLTFILTIILIKLLTIWQSIN